MPEARRGPGRPARLSKTRIAEAAVALADDAGLDGVTMRSVARALSGTPGALYRHVGNRDDLLAAMQDAVLGEIALAGAADRTARSRLERLAVALVNLHRDHVWLSDVPPAPQPVGRSAALVDSILDVLQQTGAPRSAQWAALAVFLSLVSGVARWGDRTSGRLPDARAAAIVVDAVFGVLNPQR